MRNDTLVAHYLQLSIDIRDLKMENILLDKKKRNVKIVGAWFDMQAQVQ